MNNTSYLLTQNMTVGYHKTPLIREINLEVKPGEVLTLIGPNGSGKSTILKSITKQLSLIGGTVYLDKVAMSGMTEQEISRKMSVVMTDRVSAELMTCYDVVSTGRYPYTGHLGILSKEDKEKVMQAMEMVHALDLAEKDFSAISDGQRQRVLLARAICQEPEIIVLDEPTSFLDIRHKMEFLKILRNMAKDMKKTVVMSLHEIELAYKMSDKILCVKGDRIEHFGTVKEIFQKELIRELFELDEETFQLYFDSISFQESGSVS